MIFKKAFLLFLLLIPNYLYAQANEIPLFEGVTKTTEQKAADQQFIIEATKAANGDINIATKHMIAKGWDAIQKNDLSTATKRFNQAYLLNPNDYNLYWGLGIVSNIKGDFENSEKLFAKGAALDRKDIRFLSDYGFALQQGAIFFAHKNKVDPRPKLKEAQKLFEEAIKRDPKQALPHARLAVIYYYLGDCTATKAEVAKAESLGGEGLDPRFIKDMKTNCTK
jgi:Tfp pilus assembly protein PilF